MSQYLHNNAPGIYIFFGLLEIYFKRRNIWQSCKYNGDEPLTALNVWNRSLYYIRSSTEDPIELNNTGAMWLYFFVRVMILAAVF